MQKRAEKLCGFTFQPLKARREASCFGLLCKMLDGVGVQPLLDMCPQFQLEDCSSGVVGGIGINSSSTRSCNLQVTNMVGKLRDGTSLRTFERSFIAQAHHIFNKLPVELKAQGLELGWMSVLKAGQRFLAPYRVSDIHSAADIKQFGWRADLQVKPWLGLNNEITFSD